MIIERAFGHRFAFFGLIYKIRVVTRVGGKNVVFKYEVDDLDTRDWVVL